MSTSGKQLGHSAIRLPEEGRVLIAERGGLLVAVSLPNIGRALPVRCSARLPLSVTWCAGRAIADGFGVWLLDVAPSAPTRDPDHALLAPGETPAWAVRVDRVIGLATVISVTSDRRATSDRWATSDSSTTANNGANWPEGWPTEWGTSCILADGRQAGLLASDVISRELAGVAA